MDIRSALGQIGFIDEVYDAAGEMLLELRLRGGSIAAADMSDLVDAVALKDALQLPPSLDSMSPIERVDTLQDALLMLLKHQMIQCTEGDLSFTVVTDAVARVRNELQQPDAFAHKNTLPAGTIFTTTAKPKFGQRKRGIEVMIEWANDWQIIKASPTDAVSWGPPELVYIGAGGAYYHALVVGPLMQAFANQIWHSESNYERSRDRRGRGSVAQW